MTIPATENEHAYTAFAGHRQIASGDLQTTVLKTKKRLDGGETAPILIFDDSTGKQVDFDFRGTPEKVLQKLSSHPIFVSTSASTAPPSGPGRPKLGIVSREISLLPRHWDWLEQQPQGISGTLRKLVENARKTEPNRERARRARDAAGAFMWAMAGNFPGFEEASRALYASDMKKLDKLIQDWPGDIRKHLLRLMKKSEALAE
jgi:hypothetical protein